MTGRRRWPAVTASAVAALLVACTGPAATALPTPSPTCTPETERPPTATLLDISGNHIEAERGALRFCGDISGSPSAENSGRPLVDLPRDTPNVVVSTVEGTPIVGWRAYSTGLPGSPPGAVNLGEGSEPNGVQTVSLAGPHAGEWTLVVTLTYAGDTGSAMYIWYVRAP